MEEGTVAATTVWWGRVVICCFSFLTIDPRITFEAEHRSYSYRIEASMGFSTRNVQNDHREGEGFSGARTDKDAIGYRVSCMWSAHYCRTYCTNPDYRSTPIFVPVCTGIQSFLSQKEPTESCAVALTIRTTWH